MSLIHTLVEVAYDNHFLILLSYVWLTLIISELAVSLGLIGGATLVSVIKHRWFYMRVHWILRISKGLISDCVFECIHGELGHVSAHTSMVECAKIFARFRRVFILSA